MDIYLYGCGGHAKVILDILHQQGQPVTAFIDDKPSTRSVHGVPTYAAADALAHILPDRCQWIVAIGNNSTRQLIVEKLTLLGHSFTTAIHPSAQIAIGVAIAPGTVVMANAVINTDTQVGNHVIVNTGATIDHDCVIEDFCHVAPGCSVCGHVKLGTGTFLGSGTCVCPLVEVGPQTTCGAGSVVTRSLPGHCLAYGCPATVIEFPYSPATKFHDKTNLAIHTLHG